jgi:hypothetical protein
MTGSPLVLGTSPVITGSIPSVGSIPSGEGITMGRAAG